MLAQELKIEDKIQLLYKNLTKNDKLVKCVD